MTLVVKCTNIGRTFEAVVGPVKEKLYEHGMNEPWGQIFVNWYKFRTCGCLTTHTVLKRMRVTDFVSCDVLVMKEKRGTCWIHRPDQLRLRKSCPACQGQHVWPYVYFPTIKHFHSSVPIIILFRLVHNDAYTEISRPGFMRQGFFIFCSFPFRTGYNFWQMLLPFVGLHSQKQKRFGFEAMQLWKLYI